MSLVQRTVCNCDVCGHEWIAEVDGKLPARCPSRKCRSTQWNAKEVPPDPTKLVPAIVASSGKFDKTLLEATDFVIAGEPYRASYKPKKRGGDPLTLQESLCRHGLYAANCSRCA